MIGIVRRHRRRVLGVVIALAAWVAALLGFQGAEGGFSKWTFWELVLFPLLVCLPLILVVLFLREYRTIFGNVAPIFGVGARIAGSMAAVAFLLWMLYGVLSMGIGVEGDHVDNVGFTAMNAFFLAGTAIPMLFVLEMVCLWLARSADKGEESA